MQQLLKPKKGWVEVKLTDVLDYIHGKAHEQDIVEDGQFIVVNSISSPIIVSIKYIFLLISFATIYFIS